MKSLFTALTIAVHNVPGSLMFHINHAWLSLSDDCLGQTAMLMDEFYNFFDLHFLSWTQWAWFNAWDNKTFDGWNLENFSIVDIFKNVRPNYAIRPYPRAIAGIPISFAVTHIPLCSPLLNRGQTINHTTHCLTTMLMEKVSLRYSVGCS